MPALQNLVLTDRQTTPVAHTFVPQTVTKEGVAIVNEITGAAVGDPRYTISTRRASGKMKSRVTFHVPVVQTETINGISKPKVVREGVIDATFTFSMESTEAERNNAIGMFADSMGVSKTLVNDTLVKGQGVWGA